MFMVRDVPDEAVDFGRVGCVRRVMREGDDVRERCFERVDRRGIRVGIFISVFVVVFGVFVVCRGIVGGFFVPGWIVCYDEDSIGMDVVCRSQPVGEESRELGTIEETISQVTEGIGEACDRFHLFCFAYMFKGLFGKE